MSKAPVLIAALILGAFAVGGVGLVAITHEMTQERIAANERDAAKKTVESTTRTAQRAQAAVKKVTDQIPQVEATVKQTEEEAKRVEAALGAAKEESSAGEKPYRARQLMQWIYQRGVTSFAEMTDLSKSLRAELDAQMHLWQDLFALGRPF